MVVSDIHVRLLYLVCGWRCAYASAQHLVNRGAASFRFLRCGTLPCPAPDDPGRNETHPVEPRQPSWRGSRTRASSDRCRWPMYFLAGDYVEVMGPQTVLPVRRLADWPASSDPYDVSRSHPCAQDPPPSARGWYSMTPPLASKLNWQQAEVVLKERIPILFPPRAVRFPSVRVTARVQPRVAIAPDSRHVCVPSTR